MRLRRWERLGSARPPRPQAGRREDFKGDGYRREDYRREEYKMNNYRRKGYREGGGGRKEYSRERFRSKSPGDWRERLWKKEDETEKLKRKVIEMESKMKAIETKNESNNFELRLKKNHNQQVKFCEDVKDTFDEIKWELVKLFPDRGPEYSDLGAAVSRGRV